MAEVVPISEARRQSREAVLTNHLAAHNAGDVDALLATFSRPRMEFVPSGRVFDGEEAVRSHLVDRHKSFPDAHFDIISLHHSADAVICEYWMTATHEGAYNEVEPTGRRFKVRMAAIFEFDGDLIRCQRLYYDAGTIVRQLA